MTEKIQRILKKFTIPELQRDAVHPDFAPVLIGQIHLVEKRTLCCVIALLRSEEMKTAIERGEITIGMIKPCLSEAMRSEKADVVRGKTDAEIAELLIKQIQEPLQILFQVSLTLNKEEIRKFYDSSADSQRSVLPIDPLRYGKLQTNRWDEYCALMTRGPVTFLVFYDPQKNAVDQWRKQIGSHWNVKILREKEQYSLRACWAKDNHNNLFHGSDGVEGVKRELRFLLESLKALLTR